MIELKMTKNGDDAPVEAFYATESSAGFDIAALLAEPVTIAPGSKALISTGLSIASHQDVLVQTTDSSGASTSLRMVPELQLRPRSGLAAKFGITILNAPATIDADYRGEIKVILMNLGTEPFQVQSGDRIAQGVVGLVVQLPSLDVKTVTRGTGGFGSTGK